MSDPAVNFEAVARDDQLLTQLGSGILPDTTDQTVRALYAWRTDLDRDLDGVATPATRPANGAGRAIGIARVNGAARITGAQLNGARVNGTKVNGTKVNGVKLNGAGRVNGVHRDGAGTPAVELEPDDDIQPFRRPGRRRAMVAAVVVGLSGGLGSVAVAAADARPGSPLWPITKVIYADTAEDRQAAADAAAALAKARQALEDGRVDDAERYLDEADRRADSADSAESEDLQDEVDEVREQLQDREEKPTTPDDPDNPPDDDSDPPGTTVPTPSLPAPGAEDGKDGRDGERDGRDGKDGRDGGKERSGSSEELSLVPDTEPITKQLPEL